MSTDEPTLHELARYDWVVAYEMQFSRVIHQLAAFDDPELAEDEWGGQGRTSCGLKTYLCIPGLFTRMDAPRCKTCCKIAGFPEGIGSPKNDDDLRPLVGLRAKRH